MKDENFNTYRNLEVLVDYYRKNTSCYVEEFLNIKINVVQKILLYMVIKWRKWRGDSR